MKSLKMLLMAAFTILTISVFAQNNTGRSLKEQMKMKVTKVQSSGAGEYSNAVLVSGLSSKEQMKTNVMKLNTVTSHHELTDNRSGKCPECITLLNLSPKEQMKMKVMNKFTCSMRAGKAGIETGKCSICGMELSMAKSK